MSTTYEAIPGQTDLEGNEAPPAPTLPLQHVVIDGSAQQTLDLGGKRAQTATLKIKGANLRVEGGFKKGDTLQLEVDVVITEVTSKDTLDKETGFPVEATDIYGATVLSVEVVA